MDTLRPLPSDLVELRRLRTLVLDLRQQLAAIIVDADHKLRALTSLFTQKRWTMELESFVCGDTTPPSPAISQMDELAPYLPPETTQFIIECFKQAGQRELMREQRELDLAISDELDGEVADAVAAGADGDDARRSLAHLFSYFGRERDLAELSTGLAIVREAIIALENRVCAELDERATRKPGTEQSEGAGHQTPDDRPPAPGTRKPTGDETNRYAALDKMQPAERLAYLSYLYADAMRPDDARGRRLTRPDAWQWLLDNKADGYGSGELAGYELPEFDTWVRQEREARKATGERVNTPRTARTPGRSIVRGDNPERQEPDDE
jgi:hypothetical protein